MSWTVQRQWRNHADTVTASTRDAAHYTDEQIAKYIMDRVSDGWRVVRHDAISVTLRWDGPAGGYQFIHCWREGYK